MRTLVFGLALATFVLAPNALANPRALPFTYTSDTLAKGEAEVEQYVDLVPVNGGSQTNATGSKWYTASQFQTEYEYGITNSLELGLYVMFAPQASDVQQAAVLTEGTGLKQRLRYRLADEGEWPIDVSFYGELVENENEFEVEAKILLQRRFGHLRIAANVWAEREFYYGSRAQDWVFNPTAGATYEVTPAFHAGFEWWMRAEYPDSSASPRPFALGPHQFVGPAMMFNFGRIWWTSGLYARVDDVTHVAAPGDNFGPLWFRSIIGINL